MQIKIINNGEVIWMRDSVTLEGMASRGYVKDGTQNTIIAVLKDALAQAEGELLCWNDSDTMTNIT
ncbi:Rrf2 family transcriptional regulator [Hafnia paralvei]|nr:Rrf2 family transcriptional regulator [Hafnia paralvei]